MRLLRNPWTRAFLAWTVVLVVAGTLLGIDALIGIQQAQNACFLQTAPCPEAGHPDIVQLQFVFLGVPLIWLVGVMLGVVGRAMARGSRSADP